jgi:uncharacterized surface protein with fasciclin (FAS1) repeats
MSYITQVVFTDKNLTTLKKGIMASDHDQVLSRTGPFTVFAPTDLAFSKLDAGTMDNLLLRENKVALSNLIDGHVVEGKLKIADLKDGDKLKTLNGKELSVQVKDGQVSLNGATVQTSDIKSTNGVIHSLDTVLNK